MQATWTALWKTEIVHCWEFGQTGMPASGRNFGWRVQRACAGTWRPDTVLREACLQSWPLVGVWKFEFRERSYISVSFMLNTRILSGCLEFWYTTDRPCWEQPPIKAWMPKIYRASLVSNSHEHNCKTRSWVLLGKCWTWERSWRPLTQAQKKKAIFPQRLISELRVSQPFHFKEQAENEDRYKKSFPVSPTDQCCFLTSLGCIPIFEVWMEI